MSCSNLFLNLNDPHQIIDKTNTYHLSRKLLTIHADDREKKYHPESNEFSIKCPQAYTNVQSMKLTEISFPQPIYNFSEKLNNNKFKIGGEDKEIPDGFYTPEHLANTMTNLTNFTVIYNEPESKFIIGISSETDFSLNHIQGVYCKNNVRSYPDISSGLLYEMGFDDLSITPKNADYKTTWLLSTAPQFNNDIKRYYESNSMVRFLDKQPIYMEIDKHNLYDELNVYPKGSNNTYNNFSNSSTNTAFVKIPPSTNKCYESTDYDHAIVFFEPPLQRLQNLKFKFRYHDGRLVDFANQDVNFTLEINQLRDEIPTQLNIRTPA